MNMSLKLDDYKLFCKGINHRCEVIYYFSYQATDAPLFYKSSTKFKFVPILVPTQSELNRFSSTYFFVTLTYTLFVQYSNFT